ncbi:MAG: low molecular weight phosphotyrosine protein phosphatase [Propionibacteriales bacterium]|nr:low molecular weight phosphotyrosine protein phosphatase [Propionibacteriales bacterium]
MADYDPLPAARNGHRYRIGVVCLGNICRSPIADTVLRDKIERAGLADLVEIDSAGTGDWHIGHPMDRRAAAVLATSGYDGSRHRAQQLTPRWYSDHDLLLAMDASNLRGVQALAPDPETAAERTRMFREFDPWATEDDREVPDPYYDNGDGFALVLAMIERTADELTHQLQEHLRPE